MKYVKDTFVEVFSYPWYLMLFVFTAAAFFVFNVAVVNYSLIINSFSFNLLFYLVTGSYFAMTKISFYILLVISLLTGILVSLIVFQIKKQINISKSENVGILGVAGGVLVPGCASCGLGMLSFLGLTGFAGVLPFKGLEFGVFSVAALFVAIFFVSKKISIKSCEI